MLNFLRALTRRSEAKSSGLTLKQRLIALHINTTTPYSLSK